MASGLAIWVRSTMILTGDRSSGLGQIDEAVNQRHSVIGCQRLIGVEMVVYLV